jgi:hypothetical protein
MFLSYELLLRVLNRRCSTIGCILQYSIFEHDSTRATERNGKDTGPVLRLVWHGFSVHFCMLSRSQWPRGLRRRSAVARLLRLWVRIRQRTWMVFCCKCCVLSGRGSATGWSLIQRSPTDWHVVVSDLETLWMRRPWPTGGCSATSNCMLKALLISSL